MPFDARFLIVARAFAAARWRALVLRTPQAVIAHQRRGLNRLLRGTLPALPYYRGKLDGGFEGLPIIDKAELLANFPAMNRAGITVEAARAAIEAGQERVGDWSVGRSTGTSGNRGYYVISDAERFVWLGTILAKTLPDALWAQHRVALAMPGLSDLYQSASSGSRISLGFFDLAQGVDAWIDRLTAFAPDTIVAPPKVLRHLAEAGRLTASHIFSGAEVLDPLDRAVIESAAGVRVREIYMATEGLFGVACPHGTLHLAEDVVHFEWSQPETGSALVSPIVTDFTRTGQAMVRYRMNDLLALSSDRCPCRSPYRAVARIEGRQDDCFILGGRMVTPDVIRNAIVDAHPSIRDFRAVQIGSETVAVQLDLALPEEIDALVRESLHQRLEHAGATATLNITRGLEAPYDRKLRRVRRAWQEASGL